MIAVVIEFTTLIYCRNSNLSTVLLGEAFTSLLNTLYVSINGQKCCHCPILRPNAQKAAKGYYVQLYGYM